MHTYRLNTQQISAWLGIPILMVVSSPLSAPPLENEEPSSELACTVGGTGRAATETTNIGTASLQVQGNIACHAYHRQIHNLALKSYCICKGSRPQWHRVDWRDSSYYISKTNVSKVKFWHQNWKYFSGNWAKRVRTCYYFCILYSGLEFWRVVLWDFGGVFIYLFLVIEYRILHFLRRVLAMMEKGGLECLWGLEGATEDDGCQRLIGNSSEQGLCFWAVKNPNFSTFGSF